MKTLKTAPLTGNPDFDKEILNRTPLTKLYSYSKENGQRRYYTFLSLLCAHLDSTTLKPILHHYYISAFKDEILIKSAFTDELDVDIARHMINTGIENGIWIDEIIELLNARKLKMNVILPTVRKLIPYGYEQTKELESNPYERVRDFYHHHLNKEDL